MLEKQAKQVDLNHQSAGLDSFKEVLKKAKEKGVELSFEDIREIQKQTQEVRLKYFGTKEWLKAPNGKESKLTEGQWLAVRTPYFKAWFGDWENDHKNASKVLNPETGEPLVLYHGSIHDIEEFQSSAKMSGNIDDNHAVYFTESVKVAEFHAENSLGFDDKGDTVYPVFLNIKNPKVIDNSFWKSIKVIFKKDPSYEWDSMKARHVKSDALERLKEGGFDGYVNRDPHYNFYVIFDANQVKSAIGNIGTFSKNSDDVSL